MGWLTKPGNMGRPLPRERFYLSDMLAGLLLAATGLSRHTGLWERIRLFGATVVDPNSDEALLECIRGACGSCGVVVDLTIKAYPLASASIRNRVIDFLGTVILSTIAPYRSDLIQPDRYRQDLRRLQRSI